MDSVIKQFAELKYKRKEVSEFLKDPAIKKQLKEEKKATPLKYDISVTAIDKALLIEPDPFDLKSVGIELAEGEVFVVGNSVGFLDSHQDVSLKGSWTKTAQERGIKMPLLKDHRNYIDNLYAKNNATMVVEMPIRSLGYDKAGNVEVIGSVIKPYNGLDYQKYVDKTIREHSMGLRYVKIALCVNDATLEEEFKAWEMYKSQVINMEEVMELGYFWGVQEQKAIHLSPVVEASNPFTPAFTDKSLLVEPPIGTQKEKPTNENDWLNFMIA